MLSEAPPIPENVPMTALEKRLARRIHNQRRRLAQLEKFKGDSRFRYDLRRYYVRRIIEMGNENAKLRAALSEKSS